MTKWQERSQAKIYKKRRGLEAQGSTSADASALVEWALRTARNNAPPERNSDEFLRELDRQLAACDRLVKR
jgi:hypothetical protein